MRSSECNAVPRVLRPVPMVVLQTTRTQYTGKPRPSLSGMFGPHRPRSSNTRTDCIGAGDFYPQTSCPPVLDDFHHVANSASLVRFASPVALQNGPESPYLRVSRVATLCVTSAPFSQRRELRTQGASLPDSLPRSPSTTDPPWHLVRAPAAKCADRRLGGPPHAPIRPLHARQSLSAPGRVVLFHHRPRHRRVVLPVPLVYGPTTARVAAPNIFVLPKSQHGLMTSPQSRSG